MKKSTKMILSSVMAVFLSVSALSAKSKSAISLIPHADFGLTSLGTTTPAESNSSNVTRPFGQNLIVGAGLDVNYAVTNEIGVQAGISYMNNNIGKKFTTTTTVPLIGTTTVTNTTSTSTYSSLEIPVLFTFNISQVKVEAGPYVSIPLGSLSTKGTASIKINDNDPTSTSSTVTSSFETKANYGLLFGGAWEKKISGGKLVLGARYIMDLTPTKVCSYDSNGNKIDNSTEEVFTRRALLMNVGMKFAL